jgi:hypothetical protein
MGQHGCRLNERENHACDAIQLLTLFGIIAQQPTRNSYNDVNASAKFACSGLIGIIKFKAQRSVNVTHGCI